MKAVTSLNKTTRFLITLQFLFIYLPFVVAAVSVSASSNEYGTYINPNPRPVNKCEPNDLIKLSGCCNDVLTRLDECKPDDLACECCALQSIEQECYHLCPGNPSTNFLTVLLNDCVELSEINACSLPFKKDDDSTIKIKKKKGKSNDIDNEEDQAVTSIKSKVHPKSDFEVTDHKGDSGISSLHSSESPFRNKKIKLVLNEDSEDSDNSDEEDEPQVRNYTNVTANLTGNEWENSAALDRGFINDTWLFIILFISFLIIFD